MIDEIVDKYSNIYDRAIKKKHVNTNSGTYIDFDVEHNDKQRKLKLSDHIRI